MHCKNMKVFAFNGAFVTSILNIVRKMINFVSLLVFLRNVIVLIYNNLMSGKNTCVCRYQLSQYHDQLMTCVCGAILGNF